MKDTLKCNRFVGFLLGQLFPLFLLAFTVPLPAQSGDQPNEVDYYAGSAQLREYVERALERNPSIQVALSQYRAALQQIPQVTALPDPMFSFTQFVRSVETRVGPQLNSFMVSQKFPWFGKLDLKEKMAVKQAAALSENLEATKREIVSRVKTSFYDLGYADRAIQISREEQSLLEHYESLAEARYATGQGLQQAVIKLQAEITRVVNRLQLLGQQRESLVARLNTLMSRAPEDSIAISQWVPLPQVSLDLQELYRLGRSHRQELKATEAEIEKQEEAVELRKKDFWPDLTLSAGTVNVGGRSDPAALLMPPPQDGKNAYSFSVGVNLPIWKEKYRAGVRQANERLLGERQKYASLRNQMDFSIRDEVVRLQTLRDQMQLFDQVLIPQAQETLNATEAAYQTGQVGALDLLDSERTLLGVRLVRARYHAEYLKALAQLERAIGTRFPR